MFTHTTTNRWKNLRKWILILCQHPQSARKESLSPIFVTLVAAVWILAYTRSYPNLAPRPQIRIISFPEGCVLANYANSEFILRKIWGRLQTVVAFWKIEILEDWHLSYHFKSFDIITIFGRFPGFIHLPYNFFAFFSIFTANWSVRIVGMVFQTRSS